MKHPTRPSRLWPVTALVTVGLLLASVHDSMAITNVDPSTDALLAEAAAAVLAAQEPVEFEAPGPPIDASLAAGRTVYWLPIDLSVDFSAVVTEAIEEAFGEVGVNVVVRDQQGNPANTIKHLDEARTQGADLVIIMSMPTEVLAAPLAELRDAGIPVIQAYVTDDGEPTELQSELGVVANVTYCASCVGTLMADVAITDSGGRVSAAAYTLADVGIAQIQNDAISAELERVCPETCSLTVKPVNTADVSTEIPTLTQSDIVTGDFDYFMPVYDFISLFMMPAMAAAGRELPIVTYNASAAVMPSIADGPVIGNIGTSVPWNGWAIVDQSLRVLTGGDPVPDAKIQMRLFTPDNIDMIDLNDESTDSWFGTDFRAEYRVLWGVN